MATIKILKPDGAGHMKRLFDFYASATFEDGAITQTIRYQSFLTLIKDMVGDDISALDLSGLFEVSWLGLLGCERVLKAEPEGALRADA